MYWQLALVGLWEVPLIIFYGEIGDPFSTMKLKYLYKTPSSWARNSRSGFPYPMIRIISSGRPILPQIMGDKVFLWQILLGNLIIHIL